MAIAAFVIYMPIEAYKTARARELGLPPPDPFGFNNLFFRWILQAAPTAASAKPGRSGEYSNADQGAPPLVPPPVEPVTDAPQSRVPLGHSS